MPSINVNVTQDATNPTMMDLLPFARISFGLGRNETSKDEQLIYLATLAVAKYGTIKPYVRRVTFQTVQGQLAYDLPADCRVVLDAAIPSQYGYYNDWLFLPMIDTPSSSLFGYSDYAFRSPSERIVRQDILLELDHYAQAFTDWYTDGNPLQLYILPTSTAGGLPIILKYAAEHPNLTPNAPLDPTWKTLGAGHWQQIIRLLKWAVADTRADAITSSMALSELGGGNTQLTESWKLGNRAERILQQVRSELGADVGIAIRS